MSRFTSVSLGNVLKSLYAGEDYRGEVVSVIQDEFLSFVIDFFKQVAIAKLENDSIDQDWYRANFIDNTNLDKIGYISTRKARK